MGTDAPGGETLRHWRGRLGELVPLETIDQKKTVARVSDGAGRSFVLKQVQHPERAGGIEAQCRILHHLRESGVPVAPPIPTDAGCSWVEDTGRVYTLSSYLPGGSFIAEEDLERAHRNIGRAIGDLHRALASYPDPIQSRTMDLSTRIFEETVPIVRAGLDPAERARFDAGLATAEAEMRAAFAGLPVQHIHGDCHGANILLLDGEVSGFLDLDHLPMAPRIYDLAYMLADMVKQTIDSAEEMQRRLTLAARVVAGYEEGNALSARERTAIWSVMLAVQLLFTEYFCRHDNAAERQVNLNAFYWLLEHREEILCMLRSPGAITTDRLKSASG